VKWRHFVCFVRSESECDTRLDDERRGVATFNLVSNVSHTPTAALMNERGAFRAIFQWFRVIRRMSETRGLKEIFRCALLYGPRNSRRVLFSG
jgi:hypothetical protein